MLNFDKKYFRISRKSCLLVYMDNLTNLGLGLISGGKLNTSSSLVRPSTCIDFGNDI